MMIKKAMEAAIGNSKDYTLKSYVIFVKKLQAKAEVGLHFLLSIVIVVVVFFFFYGLKNWIFNCLLGKNLIRMFCN